MSERQEHIRNIKVFISSPGDLVSERTLIVKICDEITRDLGSLKDFRVEPVRWETHAHSGIGERSQEVVMSGIGSYDIYVGVMGYYFGSDTGKFASGTEEEFRDALEQHGSNGGQKLQFYFSEASVSPKSLDMMQYNRVETFRKEVAGIGVFYREFSDLPKLEALVRPALIAAIYGVLENDDGQKTGRIDSAGKYSDLKPYDRLKNLNKLFEADKEAAVQLLTQEAAASMALVTADLNISAAHIEKFNKSMREATRELEAVNRNPKKKNYFLKKIESVFQSMEAFNHWLYNQIEFTEINFSVSLSAFQRAALILKEVSVSYDSDVQGPRMALARLRESFDLAMVAGRSTALNMPDIPALGQRWSANRKIYGAILTDFSDFLQRAIDTIDEVERQISSSI